MEKRTNPPQDEADFNSKLALTDKAYEALKVLRKLDSPAEDRQAFTEASGSFLEALSAMIEKDPESALFFCLEALHCTDANALTQGLRSGVLEKLGRICRTRLLADPVKSMEAWYGLYHYSDKGNDIYIAARRVIALAPEALASNQTLVERLFNIINADILAEPDRIPLWDREDQRAFINAAERLGIQLKPPAQDPNQFRARHDGQHGSTFNGASLRPHERAEVVVPSLRTNSRRILAGYPPPF